MLRALWAVWPVKRRRNEVDDATVRALLVLGGVTTGVVGVVVTSRIARLGTHLTHATVRVLEHSERLVAELAQFQPAIGRHAGGVGQWNHAPVSSGSCSSAEAAHSTR